MSGKLWKNGSSGQLSFFSGPIARQGDSPMDMLTLGRTAKGSWRSSSIVVKFEEGQLVDAIASQISSFQIFLGSKRNLEAWTPHLESNATNTIDLDMRMYGREVPRSAFRSPLEESHDALSVIAKGVGGDRSNRLILAAGKGSFAELFAFSYELRLLRNSSWFLSSGLSRPSQSQLSLPLKCGRWKSEELKNDQELAGSMQEQLCRLQSLRAAIEDSDLRILPYQSNKPCKAKIGWERQLNAMGHMLFSPSLSLITLYMPSLCCHDLDQLARNSIIVSHCECPPEKSSLLALPATSPSPASLYHTCKARSVAQATDIVKRHTIARLAKEPKIRNEYRWPHICVCPFHAHAYSVDALRLSSCLADQLLSLRAVR